MSNIKKLNEEVKSLLEGQYQEGPEVEETYVVTFTDGTKDNNFTVEDYEVLYKGKHIADLIELENNQEIADKINTYCELELNKEVEDIEDGIGQSLLESMNEDDNRFETVKDWLNAKGWSLNTLASKIDGYGSTRVFAGEVLEDKVKCYGTSEERVDQLEHEIFELFSDAGWYEEETGHWMEEPEDWDDIDESMNEAKVTPDHIKEVIYNEVEKFFKKDLKNLEPEDEKDILKDIMEYVVVETKENDGKLVVEVRAELDYEGMVKLAEHLDKVIKKFDKEAYFDQEEPGIMTAFLNVKVNESIKVKEITRDEWNKTPGDYKMMKDGKPYLVYLDDESHHTVLGPCKIVDESINEAKINGFDFDLENAGCGMELRVSQDDDSDSWVVSLDGYSNNTETNIDYINEEIIDTGDEGKKLINQKREEVAPEIAQAVQEFDSKINEIMNAHGFHKKGTNESLNEAEIQYRLYFDGEPQGQFTEKELVERAREVMYDADERMMAAKCHDIDDVKALMKGLGWKIK